MVVTNVKTITIIKLRSGSINNTTTINMLMLLVAKAKDAFANRHIIKQRNCVKTTTIIQLGGGSINDTITINMVMLLAAKATDALASRHVIKQIIYTIKH